MLNNQGYTLVLNRWNGGTLQLLVEHKDGSSITIKDCVDISKIMKPALETRLNTTTLRLEISSPGVNRPLIALQDFIRYEGERMVIHTIEPVENQQRFTAILKKVHNKTLILENNLTLLFSNIKKAYLSPELPIKGKP